MNSIADKVRTVSASLENATRAGEFISAVRCLMLAPLMERSALEIAESAGTPERVKSCIQAMMLKAPVGGMGTDDNSDIYDYRVSVSAFLASLRAHGCFDAILSSTMQMPLHTRVAVTASAITGDRMDERQVKPIRALALANRTLEPVKVTAQCILTRELLNSSRPEAAGVIATELRHAIAVASDQAFFDLILTGIVATPSAGSDVVAVRADLTAALDVLVTGADSKIFFVVGSSVAKRLALMGDASGASAFPQMSPTGGTIGNVQTLVSDGLPDNSLVALDASQIAAGSEGLVLDTSLHADVQMDDAPNSPPTASTVRVNLFQENKAATRLERYFGAERLRDGAVALIDGVNYSGNSPA